MYHIIIIDDDGKLVSDWIKVRQPPPTTPRPVGTAMLNVVGPTADCSKRFGLEGCVGNKLTEDELEEERLDDFNERMIRLAEQEPLRGEWGYDD